MTDLEGEKVRLEVRIAACRLDDESKTVITEDVLRQLFAEFKGFVTTWIVPDTYIINFPSNIKNPQPHAVVDFAYSGNVWTLIPKRFGHLFR
ncbi:hypothetical protein [Paenibacillus cymbidii]|uniref:hypothetical protein n=1 Tax=Paenibacillus cymbidii TaxID=1639034 RepID=UPI0010803B42|nr:hypothetical protein [Paenibacillus cymbidii]